MTLRHKFGFPLLVLLLWMLLSILPRQSRAIDNVGPALQIANISTNATDYLDQQIPKYGKLEITFQITGTVAGNFQFPYDPAPPNGIDPGNPLHQGISVDAHFLPPGETDWTKAYQQPAFYYQHFEDEVKKSWDGRDREWYYPSGEFSWKVRFAPHLPGNWQFKLTAQDAAGRSESPPQPFSVINSTAKGFLKVSQSDPRYFEFDNGAVFHPLGFGFAAHLADPVLANEADYMTFQQNKINLLRVWVSSLYGAAWLNYLGNRNLYDGYLPRAGLLPFNNNGQLSMALRLDYEPAGNEGWFDACRFEFWNDPEPVQTNTDYRIQIKYRGVNITGPRETSTLDYGFVAKLGGWHPDCYNAGVGTVVTSYGLNNSDWGVIEGEWNSGDNNFLPRLYMVLENVIEGEAYIDSVSVQEVLGGGGYGPNIMVEPSMQYELYYPQSSLYAMDKLIDLAEQMGIYLKLVIMEKQDVIYRKLEDNGDFVLTGPDNPDGFYGQNRTVNKTRWLQQAWWRYLQARYGYSPAIHSWEVNNEGDPANGNHYALTDEMGKFMHCRVFGVSVGEEAGEKCTFDHPNDHLVSTSFWHSFPAERFWTSPDYPNVDYADVHAYISTGWLNDPIYEQDAAQFHLDYSAELRSNLDWHSGQNGQPTKPIIRGETGLDFLNQQTEQPDLAQDTEGIWLHNMLWSTLDSGALTELYWWGKNIAEQPGPDGQPGLHEIYRTFYHFVESIPLNNGHFQDAKAQVSDEGLRAVGQKDLHNHQAHLWIQNKAHTWKNVIGSANIPPRSGTVTIPGFRPNQSYQIQWWDTYATNPDLQITGTETITSNAAGALVLPITNLTQDIALKVTSGTMLPPADFSDFYLPVIFRFQ